MATNPTEQFEAPKAGADNVLDPSISINAWSGTSDIDLGSNSGSNENLFGNGGNQFPNVDLTDGANNLSSANSPMTNSLDNSMPPGLNGNGGGDQFNSNQGNELARQQAGAQAMQQQIETGAMGQNQGNQAENTQNTLSGGDVHSGNPEGANSQGHSDEGKDGEQAGKENQPTESHDGTNTNSSASGNNNGEAAAGQPPAGTDSNAATNSPTDSPRTTPAMPPEDNQQPGSGHSEDSSAGSSGGGPVEATNENDQTTAPPQNSAPGTEPGGSGTAVNPPASPQRWGPELPIN